MNQIAVFEAKTRLSELLAEVEQDELFTIPRHGTPLARLIGAGTATSDHSVADARRQQVTQALRELTELRQGIALDLPLCEAIGQGRD